MSITSIFIAAALAIVVQDPPPGEVISTAPRPASAVAPTDVPPPAASGGLVWSQTPVAPERRRYGRLGESATAELERRDAAGENEFDTAFAVSGSATSAATAPSMPLPPEALADPVRYAADQCRPQVRCSSTATRDDDRRSSSTSGSCSIGSGDPALLNRALGW